MRTVALVVPAAEVELVADELWGLGAEAVEERVAADGTVLVTSFVDDATTDIAVVALAGRFALTVEEVDDDGLDGWRRFAEPVRVGERLLVEPAWLAPTARPGDVVVRIDPGRAFGSGAHATTRLVLGALVELVRPGASVLDVGCGSGVLAVAAAQLGAARVVAVDVDPAALEATAANAARNAVTLEVSATLPAEEEQFDLVVANMLAPVLVELAPALVAAVAPGGLLVVAGVLAGRASHVVAALAPLRVVASHELDGWEALRLATR